MKLVLASASPRRRELLAQLGLAVADFSFAVLATDIDESARQGEAATDFVSRLALEKAQAGLALCGDTQAVVLGSDTIVVAGDTVLGKPQDATDAFAMLRRLSGASHRVMTAVALVSATKTVSTLVTTQVTFTAMSDAQIHAYIASGEPMDKAGAYGIQGLGGSFVERIDGSYSAVVGLPLVETRSLLQQMQLI
ncbi:septum formation inhibitor Maf [Shewanella mangrovi]|uniref:dTTP/UTP pyrophosphatase n=1 Tax=Shewanella mangrovi TaxID=1515746 RepID=A0A094JII0_9GAMM|nr:Maf family protein [Shewanella mangrovi]KFZ37829.1 septum formation inhibitor Maf [Shewanella mangrovi]